MTAFADVMRKGIDVTEEYLNRSTPGDGIVSLELGYHEKEHAEEIRIANWLRDTFGGNIVLLSETGNSYLEKSADYLWNGKLWELKTVGSIKSIDSALRKGIHQIKNNSGGVILDFQKNPITWERISSIVVERIRKSKRTGTSLDVMIVNKGGIIVIMRF